MRLARLLSAKIQTLVVSIIRNPEHENEVASTGVKPLVMSLEDDPKERFA